MTFEQARVEDLEELLKLWTECRDEEAGTKEALYPKEPPHAVLEAYLRGKLDSPADFVLVARNAGQIKGFLISSLQIRFAALPTFFVAAEVFYIKPEARKGWTARDMVREWKEWVKSLGVEVETAELVAYANPTQVKRWRRKGWKPYGVLMHQDIREVRS